MFFSEDTVVKSPK